MNKAQCWMFPASPPCFVLGGRYGDIIQLLPCWKAIHDRTGLLPTVVCSKEYVSVFEGVSYVRPYPVNEHWYAGVPKMKQIAKELFGGGVVCQFWQEEPKHDDTIGFGGRGWITLQSHGHNHGVNMALDPDYGTSMARRCGFSQAEWIKLPLVFDRRDEAREIDLVKNLIREDKRPVVLYNFSGNSSPFGFGPDVTNEMLRKYGKKFKWIDLSKVRAKRIYDLLGLYDVAVGLLTGDTSTMHLAPASKVPYIGFTVDSWNSSVPKGNCVLHVKYNSTPQRILEILGVIESWQGVYERSACLV